MSTGQATIRDAIRTLSLNAAHAAVNVLIDGLPLSVRMLVAADAIEELNARYDFGPRTPWEPTELRHEATIEASEEGRP